ncbi:MAG: hypothetical protein HZB73_01450 [Nitrosarchaeum sp.]|nr:hypothetical protein [Nitrosarchaeum sp.]
MKLTIIVLITILVIGTIVIFFGYLTNQHYIQIIEKSNPYEKLQNYKEELEKINQHNQQLLSELEGKMVNSDDVHLEQLNQEIKVLKRVINDNKVELEQVIKKLSTLESKP